MLLRTKLLRLLLSLSLGLAFFGCMGLPRRKPIAEQALPNLPQRPARAGEGQQAASSAASQPQVASGFVSDPPVTQASADDTPPAPMPAGTPVVRATAPPPRTVQSPPEPPPSQPLAPPQPSEPKTEKAPPPPANPLTPVRQLHQAAVKSYAGVSAYIVRLTRREFIKGSYQPEEILLFKFRKEPFSVYLKWVGQLHRGREVVYVKGRYENKLHTLLAAGDVPLMSAGKRFSLPLDSGLLRGSSRHPITEAGIGSILTYLSLALDALEKGDQSRGTLTFVGDAKRPEIPDALDAIEWKLPPGLDPSLPKGGRRWCFYYRDTHLPALVLTHDDKGQEVEYYRYDRFQLNVPLDEADFNPDKLWARPGRSPSLR